MKGVFNNMNDTENSLSVSEITAAEANDTSNLQAEKGVTPSEAVCESAVQTDAPALTAKRSQFTALECVAAWVCFVLSFIFLRLVGWEHYPIAMTCYVVAIYIASYVVVKVKGVIVNKLGLIIGAAFAALSISIILTSNAMIQTLSFFICAFGYVLSTYITTGNSLKEDAVIFFNMLKAFFIMPFSAFGKIWPAAFRRSNKANRQGDGKTVLWVLLGLLMTVIPTLLVIFLLQYDENFSRLLDKAGKLFSNLPDAAPGLFISFILSVPCAMYIFGVYFSNSRRMNNTIMTDAGSAKARINMHFLPKALVLAMAIPLLIVYVCFFATQWSYYVSAFTGILPKGYSIAEYARNGFFELLVVAVINGIAIAVNGAFTKFNSDGKPSVIQKTVKVLFIIATLVLIATAMSKLLLYVQTYGLTRKRVLAAWFMVSMAIEFILCLVLPLFKRVKRNTVMLVAAFALFAILAFSNMEGQIARFNVNAYLNGSHKSIDIQELEDLGDSAIPELVRLYNEKGDVNYRVETTLDSYSEKENLLDFTIPAVRASAAISKYRDIQKSLDK